MTIINTAVILTVFNRREITLRGLRTLYNAISCLGVNYRFDIYMTDDGSQDGTYDAVSKEFPDILIIKGNGRLFWTGGMRKSWISAVNNKVAYDYYLWFNDDVELYPDSLETLYTTYNKCKMLSIVSGGFCDHFGKVSYGGRDENNVLLEPNGFIQDITFMNGNLVLISADVFNLIGMLDKSFSHGLGDYDYGLRAKKNDIRVVLTDKYVGVCDRHDNRVPLYYSKKISVWKRLKILYSPINNPIDFFIYTKRYNGILKGIKVFLSLNINTIFPKNICND